MQAMTLTFNYELNFFQTLISDDEMIMIMSEGVWYDIARSKI